MIIHRLPIIIINLIAESWGIDYGKIHFQRILFQHYVTVYGMNASQINSGDDSILPQLIELISVVCLGGLSGPAFNPFDSTKCVLKRVFANVDFPNPDCPIKHLFRCICAYIYVWDALPTSIMLKQNPRFSNFFSACLVIVSKPTYEPGIIC